MASATCTSCEQPVADQTLASFNEHADGCLVVEVWRQAAQSASWERVLHLMRTEAELRKELREVYTAPTTIEWTEDFSENTADPNDGCGALTIWWEDMRASEVRELVKEAYERGFARGKRSNT